MCARAHTRVRRVSLAHVCSRPSALVIFRVGFVLRSREGHRERVPELRRPRRHRLPELRGHRHPAALPGALLARRLHGLERPHLTVCRPLILVRGQHTGSRENAVAHNTEPGCRATGPGRERAEFRREERGREMRRHVRRGPPHRRESRVQTRPLTAVTADADRRRSLSADGPGSRVIFFRDCPLVLAACGCLKSSFSRITIGLDFETHEKA